MITILVIGAGNIGALIACLLSAAKTYRVHVVDHDLKRLESSNFGTQAEFITRAQLNSQDDSQLVDYLEKNSIESIVSCLPYFCNISVCEVARRMNVDYFDLTEDVNVSQKVAELAIGSQKVFVPQCGLAPGFISIAAHDLSQDFERLDSVLLRVGALPQYPGNTLKYALTWSTDGLINEYGNSCNAIVNGKESVLQPLEGEESLEIDGALYEAFNTSGGLGSLLESYRNNVNNMNYKTIRYPEHAQYMRFLMNDLGLNQDRVTLKRILEAALPRTEQDLVLIYIAVKGWINQELVEKIVVKKIYPKIIEGKLWTAIQLSTAASLCSVLDMIMQKRSAYNGLVKQEQFGLDEFLANQFGAYYK